MVPVAAGQQVEHRPPVTGAAFLPAVRGEQPYGGVRRQGRGADRQIDETLTGGPLLDDSGADVTLRPRGGSGRPGGGHGHDGGAERARREQGGQGAA
ncbi:hypothetical protein ACIREO_03740 [Streptomyces sp. NPDC102441]|uniref:hypothetical protein n=1 Tax=Streptomyces sp. NPDC102441 TaxID=3366176 RepID=UPI00382EC3C8